MCRSNIPSVLGLVIMNTAVCSSSFGAQIVHIDQAARACSSPCTVSKPAIAALAGLVPWALSGVSTCPLAIPAIAKIGRGDQQRREFALGARRRLQRHGRQAGDLGQHLLQLIEQFAACPGSLSSG